VSKPSEPFSSEGRVRIRVRPGKKKDVLLLSGEEFSADLSAPAREGAANDRLLRNLSYWLAWPVSNIRIEKGESSRLKTIAIRGMTGEEVRKRLLACVQDSSNKD
jgi:uncharacterized protein YggU (UPF0235/DUF167 family)